MRVLVVGGEHRFVEGSITPKYRDLGVEVAWHWDWNLRRPGERLPDGCEGVVIFNDMVGHHLSVPAMQLANEKDVPCASVSRKIMLALPILRSKGIVPPAAVDVDDIGPETMLDVLRQYVEDERRHTGKMPSYNDAANHVQSTLGGHALVTQELLSKAKSLVAATTTATYIDRERISTWAELVVEEHFEVDQDALVDMVKQYLTEEGDAGVPAGVLSQAVSLVREQFKKDWSHGNLHGLRNAYDTWRGRHPEADVAAAVAVFGLDPEKALVGPTLEEYEDDVALAAVEPVVVAEPVKSEPIIAAPEADPIVAAPSVEEVAGIAESVLKEIHFGLAVVAELDPKRQDEIEAWLYEDRGTRQNLPFQSELRDLFKNKPLAFTAFISSFSDEGEPLLRKLVINAHRATFGRKINNTYITTVGEVLNLTISDEAPMPHKKVSHAPTGTPPRVIVAAMPVAPDPLHITRKPVDLKAENTRLMAENLQLAAEKGVLTSALASTKDKVATVEKAAKDLDAVTADLHRKYEDESAAIVTEREVTETVLIALRAALASAREETAAAQALAAQREAEAAQARGINEALQERVFWLQEQLASRLPTSTDVLKALVDTGTVVRLTKGG